MLIEYNQLLLHNEYDHLVEHEHSQEHSNTKFEFFLFIKIEYLL